VKEPREKGKASKKKLFLFLKRNPKLKKKQTKDIKEIRNAQDSS